MLAISTSRLDSGGPTEGASGGREQGHPARSRKVPIKVRDGSCMGVLVAFEGVDSEWLLCGVGEGGELVEEAGR